MTGKILSIFAMFCTAIAEEGKQSRMLITMPLHHKLGLKVCSVCNLCANRRFPRNAVQSV